MPERLDLVGLQRRRSLAVASGTPQITAADPAQRAGFRISSAATTCGIGSRLLYGTAILFHTPFCERSRCGSAARCPAPRPHTSRSRWPGQETVDVDVVALHLHSPSSARTRRRQIDEMARHLAVHPAARYIVMRRLQLPMARLELPLRHLAGRLDLHAGA